MSKRKSQFTHQHNLHHNTVTCLLTSAAFHHNKQHSFELFFYSSFWIYHDCKQNFVLDEVNYVPNFIINHAYNFFLPDSYRVWTTRTTHHTQSVCCSLQTDIMVLTSTNVPVHHTISDIHVPKPSSPTSVMFPRSSLIVISSGRL